MNAIAVIISMALLHIPHHTVGYHTVYNNRYFYGFCTVHTLYRNFSSYLSICGFMSCILQHVHKNHSLFIKALTQLFAHSIQSYIPVLSTIPISLFFDSLVFALFCLVSACTQYFHRNNILQNATGPVLYLPVPYLSCLFRIHNYTLKHNSQLSKQHKFLFNSRALQVNVRHS